MFGDGGDGDNPFAMPRFRLCHTHQPSECPAAFAAWRGFESPLRRRTTTGTCVLGGHELWWDVDAPSPVAALAMLPPFVAERSQAVEVRDIAIP